MDGAIGGAWDLVDAIASMIPSSSGGAPVTGKVTRIDRAGTPWVSLDGDQSEIPINGRVTADLSEGQRVVVGISGGRASVYGNVTSPSVGAAYVRSAVTPTAEASSRAAATAETAIRETARTTDIAKAATVASNAATESASMASVMSGIAGMVVGISEWVASHGSYEATSDEEVVEGKVYYALADGTYSLVTNPVTSDVGEYYELDLDATVSDYVSTHIVMGPGGLVMTTGDQSDYKLVISSDGATLYDGGDEISAELSGGTLTVPGHVNMSGGVTWEQMFRNK